MIGWTSLKLPFETLKAEELIKAIIFDFDGVLVESAEIKTEAFRELFRQYPLKINEIVEYHEKNMGISRFVKFRHIYNDILGRSISPAAEEELGRKFSQIVMEKILIAPLAPGTIKYLEEYYQKYPFFIASGTPEEELHFIAGKRGLSKYFKEMHGTPKKKKEIIIDIQNRYGWKPEEILFIGDAETDLIAARESGTKFVARMAHWRERAFACSLCIDDLGDLGEVVKLLDWERNSP